MQVKGLNPLMTLKHVTAVDMVSALPGYMVHLSETCDEKITMNSTNPPEKAIACLQTILDALETGNYELFLSVGDADYQTGISKEMFDSVSSQLSPRMAEGYNITYFGHLKQGETQTYLWKLSFADDGHEFIVRMGMIGDKVNLIWIT